MSKFLIGNIKGPKGDKGEQGATGPKGEQGIQGPVGPAGGVNSVNGKTGDVDIADALGYTPAGGQGVNLVSLTNWVNAGVDYASGILSLQNNRATSPIIPVENGRYTLSFIQPSDRTLELNVFAWDNTESTYIGVLLDKNINEKNIFTVNNEVGLIRLVVRGHLQDDNPVDLSLIPQLKIKLERGTVTDPVWTPAPEDVLLKGEVDGRNLLPDSKEEKTFKKDFRIVTYDIFKDHVGENISISFDMAVGASGTSRVFYIYAYQSNGLSISNSTGDPLIFTPITTYKRFSFTTSVKDWGIQNEEYTKGEIIIIDSVADFSNNVAIKNIKVEVGDVATDWTPAPEDVVTKTPPDIFAALDSIPEMHRNIFRGKNLGTVFTAEQKAAIKAGTFDDLWLGDYWIINSHTWRIVDINYWYNKGDQNCTTPHIVVMPDVQLYTHKMNNDNVTTDGYYGSLMYTEGLTQAKEIVNADFGETCVLNHRVLLTNKVDSGHASEGTWYDSTVELANEIMMYGCLVFSAMNNGTAVPYLYTTEYTQLALFRLVPRFINASRQWFWLRDVVSATGFACVNTYGYARYDGASGVSGVRPVVGITGGTASADEPDDDLEVTELSGKGGEPL